MLTKCNQLTTTFGSDNNKKQQNASFLERNRILLFTIMQLLAVLNHFRFRKHIRTINSLPFRLRVFIFRISNKTIKSCTHFICRKLLSKVNFYVDLQFQLEPVFCLQHQQFTYAFYRCAQQQQQ